MCMCEGRPRDKLRLCFGSRIHHRDRQEYAIHYPPRATSSASSLTDWERLLTFGLEGRGANILVHPEHVYRIVAQLDLG